MKVIYFAIKRKTIFSQKFLPFNMLKIKEKRHRTKVKLCSKYEEILRKAKGKIK